MEKIIKERARSYCLLLYEDDPTHENALRKIMGDYEYAGILHDRDVWTEKDEKKDPKHKAGELKKRHYHIVLRFHNGVWNTALAKDLGIELNYIRKTKNLTNALLYLLHYNDMDKAQYDIDEVFGNMKTRLNEAINEKEKSEGEKVVELIDYIHNYNGKMTVTQFAHYCAKNGYWAEFRRSGSIFCKIIEEKNSVYTVKEYPKD